MALEQELSLGQNTNSNRNPNPVDCVDVRGEGGDEGGKAPRLPRWTRQEILVLIQGKRDAENKFRRGRTAGLPLGSGQVEPKWASVSSYCRKHGVNRGPVQCRKRWSNLAGDYKKIKEWESQIREESDSFWVMRNDLRRDRKLPGFFDKEVYDILDSGSQGPALALALSSPPSMTVTVCKDMRMDMDTKRGYAPAPSSASAPAPAPAPVPAPVPAPAEPEEPHLYDSNRSVPVEDGLFSDFEQDEASASPEKKDIFPPSNRDFPAPIPISGVTNEKQSTPNPEMGSTSQGERKRKRLSTDGGEETLQIHLIDVLERNGKMLSAQLEAQNINFQLDREQRKINGSNLVAVLDKLADALGRIADKL
ncbi:trihelix transcription factor ASR3-like isoform X3 [Vigna umbellata]|uniref:trihelix transcription factor ASR3-like isoform X1 n=1 Tax=Vigna umbellata TaxID=87088 RepID=UPI001F5FE108|nr:trihelix transcription factor ASR3-like isoform X1 [Vigna umbellata]XP_047151103.1 trihelix transcription factor ASR3-like isoform X2 [Vigna umbellata]XP_047151104.1 trihelix transcription factor ASR3-like isoform X3 [Vigna umbellata]